MVHVHKWYISVDYDGFIEGLCENGSCMAHLTEAEIADRINAVEQGLHQTAKQSVPKIKSNRGEWYPNMDAE